MIHQPEGGSQGQATVVLSESEEVLRIRDEVAHIYADRTGQTVQRIARDMNRDQFLSARSERLWLQ
jgi:ATP-dependent Clp protease protease subunit